jgi:hypothetical protein
MGESSTTTIDLQQGAESLKTIDNKRMAINAVFL